jgi:hypothetical protein
MGPKALEYSSFIRTVFKQQLPMVTIGTAICMSVIGIIAFRMRKNLVRQKEIFVYLLSSVIAGASYLGLGNAAERYAFIPSIFFCIALGILFSSVWNAKKNTVMRIFLVALVIGICSWNIREVKRLEGDWQKASDVSQSALLAIKAEAYPPKDDLTFFFINPPIRYGRAWIFPTGLQDALWHMFRENLYAVNVTPTIKAAYDYPNYKGTRYVYVFDNYTLKKGLIKPIDE